MKRYTAAQLEEAARTWPGDLWRPDYVVEYHGRPATSKGGAGWYWRDRNATDGGTGPFKSARAAWADICKDLDIKPKPAQDGRRLKLLERAARALIRAYPRMGYGVGEYVERLEHALR